MGLGIGRRRRCVIGKDGTLHVEPNGRGRGLTGASRRLRPSGDATGHAGVGSGAAALR